jgi:hypothetical protein
LVLFKDERCSTRSLNAATLKPENELTPVIVEIDGGKNVNFSGHHYIPGIATSLFPMQ